MSAVQIRMLFLVLAFTFAHASHKEDMASSTSEPQLLLDCEGKALEILEPPHSNHISNVNITNCSPPIQNYVSLFEDLQIDAADISELTLDRPNKLTQLQPSHFVNLTLKSLSIRNDDERDLVRLAEGLFDPLLGTLKVLDLWRVQLPTLPDNRLEKLSVLRGSSLGELGGCSNLKRLEIMHWVVPLIPGGWLPHCHQLRELQLYHVMEQTTRHTLTGASMVTDLMIRKCALLYLTDGMFADMLELRKLVFIEHSIYGMDLGAFKSQTKLEELDMSYNEIFATRDLMTALRPMTALRNLSLAHNTLTDFCHIGAQPMILERLSLSANGLKRLCFSEWSTLQYLDLSKNNITALDFHELPRNYSRPLTVDLRKNPVHILPSTEREYRDIINRFNQSTVQTMTILADLSIDCDCQHAWFARALQALPNLDVIGAVCVSGERLDTASTELLDRLQCDRFACSGCMCRSSWADNSTVADCRHSRLQSLPELEGVNVRRIIAPGNWIDSLPAVFPDTLEFVDLRDNRMTRIDARAAAALFAVRARRVRLAGNPLVCDCENEPLVKILHEHRTQVEDFDSITCVNDGRALRDVVIDDLCDELVQLWPVIALLAVAGVVITFSTAIYCRFAKQIKVFLYARGCCLSCLKEDEINGKCEFDAFISFSHEDDEFVNESLIPGLSDYRLCIHYRHWIAGDWIPAQIARSIERSRRTIIVLSKNFLESPWGMLEFRMAHAAMLQEGRTRLIAIVLDEVIHDDALDAELRGYLASNTYIKWGDPWFFDKLKYALPHKPNSNLSEGTKCSSINLSNSSQTATVFGSWNTLRST